MERLLSVARRHVFARDEIVFRRGDPADSVHLVAAGRFAIRVRTPHGETAMLAVRGPGDNFGEMALVDAGARRAATVVALEDAETLAVHQAEFERLREEHPAVNATVSAFLAGEVRLLNERLLDALFVPAERRVFRRLHELVWLYGGGSGPVEIPFTQDELAELAGASRTTVSRALRAEQARGTVALHRGATVVLDVDAVARRAR